MILEKLKPYLPILAAGMVCAAILVYAYGCESKTKSLIYAGKRVSRQEYMLEIDTLLSKSQIGISDLDSQDELKAFIFNQVLISTQTGTVNPIGVITSLLAFLGVAVGADDIRLRKKIKKQVL